MSEDVTEEMERQAGIWLDVGINVPFAFFPSRLDWREQMWGTSPYKQPLWDEHWMLLYGRNPHVLLEQINNIGGIGENKKSAEQSLSVRLQATAASQWSLTESQLTGLSACLDAALQANSHTFCLQPVPLSGKQIWFMRSCDFVVCQVSPPVHSLTPRCT